MKRGDWIGSGVVVLSCLLGCGDEQDGRATGATLPTGVTFGSASASDTSTDSASSGMSGTDTADTVNEDTEASTSGNDDPKFDLGAAPDVNQGEPDECTKVDILFAIDNSGSMGDEQDNLIAAFPGFVTGIQDALQFAESYHIGVVTSDSYDSNENGCRGVGDLVTQTGGSDSSNAVCGPFSSGFRWFDNTEPDLASTFSCAAQVGTDGSGDEEQVHGVLRATDPDRNAPGACNDGFLRDDALLVVVLITDEEDEEDCSIFGCDGGTPAGPNEWFTRVVTNKYNIETNVVMLTLVGLPGSSCADHASRILDFGSRFTNNAAGEICAGNYAEFFTEAISQIDTACQGFTPPG